MDNNFPPIKRLALRPEWRDNRLSFVFSIKPSPTAAVASANSPAPTMEQSPLTQQARPEVFEPKVVGLYRRLFQEAEDEDNSEGFWTTLFLLKPDTAAFSRILNDTDADHLLHAPHLPQQFVLQSIAQIKLGEAPLDANALDTLTVFFAIILAKKFTNPSSDIIEVLAGLDNVDLVFSDLVATLDSVIKDGRTPEIRQKAVHTAIAIVGGGYQTALVSYFIHRDFFPSLMKLVHQIENPLHAAEPFLLTGLLANYNKFEMHNQYRVRFADFVNEDTMEKVIHSIAWTSVLLRERYIAIQDDTPNNWTLGGTLSYVGLGSIAGAKPASPGLTEEQQKELYAEQPGVEAATILTLYDFTLANRLFCRCFVSLPATEKGQPPAFASFLSFASYLYQHAYRTNRASLYSYLTLLILLILVEEDVTAKILCENTASVRLCRQRPPLLPLHKGSQTYAATVLDLMIDATNHNLRKRLDTAFYSGIMQVLSATITYLIRSRTKLAYSWSELWRSLLSFVRFLIAYPDELQSLSGMNKLVESLVELLFLALTNGEAFLPDAAAYDDLSYKLVESGEALTKLREAYQLNKSDKSSAINTLVEVSKHYNEMIEQQKSKGTHIGAHAVTRIIKQGYDTLSIETKDDVEPVGRYREADHRAQLKRIARVAVSDAAAFVAP